MKTSDGRSASAAALDKSPGGPEMAGPHGHPVSDGSDAPDRGRSKPRLSAADQPGQGDAPRADGPQPDDSRESSVNRRERGLSAEGSTKQPGSSGPSVTITAGHVLTGHTGPVLAVAIDDAGERALTAGVGGELRLWDLAAGQCAGVLEAGHGVAWSVAWGHDRRLAASAHEDHWVRVWDLAAEAGQARALEGHTEGVNCVRFSGDGRQLLSAGHDQAVRVWDVESGRCERTLRSPERVTAACFVGDSGWVASAGADGLLRLWDRVTGRPGSVIEAHAGRANCVCADAAGRRLYSGGEDGLLRVWDVDTGRCVGAFEGHEKRINAVCLNSDGRVVCSAADDRMVRVWDAASGRCLHVLADHAGWVSAVACGGGRLVTGGWDRTVRVYSLMR